MRIEVAFKNEKSGELESASINLLSGDTAELSNGVIITYKPKKSKK